MSPAPITTSAQLPAPLGSSGTARRTARTDFAWRVLEEIDYGLMLLSPSGELEHANEVARCELNRGRVIRLDGNRVMGHSSAGTEEILRCLRGAAQGRRQMLTLHHGDVSLTVACVPLSHRAEESDPVLLILARQSATQNLNVTFFSRSYGLTSAEEAVLRALHEGLRINEIASVNGVSECTIRTHVRSVRDKTGINNIRLLVQRVANLPPVVPRSLTTSAPMQAQSPV